MLQGLFVDSLLEDLYKTKVTVEKIESTDKINTKKPPESYVIH